MILRYTLVNLLNEFMRIEPYQGCHRDTSLSPPVKLYFTDRSKALLLL